MRIVEAPAKIRTAVLLTHSDPAGIADATAEAAAAAERAGVELVSTREELGKHGDSAGVNAVEELPAKPDLCLVLGGDGTILRALRTFAGAEVPVFGINFGTVGFLAAAERDELDQALERAFTGSFDVMELPSLELGEGGPERFGHNDIAFLRQPHHRVAELSYSVSGQEVGDVRCDGLVAATPAGSTGYNLANQGPILAWGVEGYALSFVAPHTFTARPLVVAPDDVLQVRNAGRDSLDIAIDGRPAGELIPGAQAEVRFRDGVGRLAQLPGSSFYRRVEEKFGRLAR
jgi:NAD+ kinase